MKKYITDSCFLVSTIRSQEPNHLPCYQFFRENEDVTWVVPVLAYFEYQAVQKQLQKRQNLKPYREVYISNLEIYDITLDLARKSSEMNLFEIFDSLRGADLIYACIAKIENIPLVTTDGDFQRYSNHIEIINPLKVYEHLR